MTAAISPQSTSSSPERSRNTPTQLERAAGRRRRTKEAFRFGAHQLLLYARSSRAPQRDAAITTMVIMDVAQRPRSPDEEARRAVTPTLCHLWQSWRDAPNRLDLTLPTPTSLARGSSSPSPGGTGVRQQPDRHSPGWLVAASRRSRAVGGALQDAISGQPARRSVSVGSALSAPRQLPGDPSRRCSRPGRSCPSRWCGAVRAIEPASVAALPLPEDGRRSRRGSRC